jgi:hypothetical protein
MSSEKVKALDELLDRGLDDMLQLSEVIGVTGRHLGKRIHDRSVEAMTLELIGDLLQSGDAIAGDLDQDSGKILYVRSWGLSPSATVERIEREWRELAKPPNLGDVVWMELTESGREKARDTRRERMN